MTTKTKTTEDQAQRWEVEDREHEGYAVMEEYRTIASRLSREEADLVAAARSSLAALAVAEAALNYADEAERAVACLSDYSEKLPREVRRALREVKAALQKARGQS